MHAQLIGAPLITSKPDRQPDCQMQLVNCYNRSVGLVDCFLSEGRTNEQNGMDMETSSLGQTTMVQH